MAQPAEKRANTLEAILEAALKVFGKRGYAGASINEVAAVAGLTKPTIYNHFRNKAELYEEMLLFGHRKMMEALEKAVARVEPSREKIVEALKAQFQVACRYPDLVKVMHTMMFLPDEVKPRINPTMFIEEKFGFIHRVVREGVDRGELEGVAMDIALVLSSVGMLCMAQAFLPSFPLLQPGLEQRLWNMVYQGARKR